MTVKELIEQLQEMPEDLQVLINKEDRKDEEDCDFINITLVQECTVRRVFGGFIIHHQDNSHSGTAVYTPGLRKVVSLV